MIFLNSRAVLSAKESKPRVKLCFPEPVSVLRICLLGENDELAVARGLVGEGLFLTTDDDCDFYIENAWTGTELRFPKPVQYDKAYLWFAVNKSLDEDVAIAVVGE